MTWEPVNHYWRIWTQEHPLNMLHTSLAVKYGQLQWETQSQWTKTKSERGGHLRSFYNLLPAGTHKHINTSHINMCIHVSLIHMPTYEHTTNIHIETHTHTEYVRIVYFSCTSFS